MKNKIELFKNQHPSMSSLIDNSMDGLPCNMEVVPVWNPLTLISRMEIYLKSETKSSGCDVITQPIVNTNLTIGNWYHGKPKVFIKLFGL